MNYREILYSQLACDFSVLPSQIAGSENLFVINRFCEGRRIYRSDGCLLKVLCINSKIVMSSTDESLLEWCRNEYMDADGPWFCDFSNLLKLQKKLQDYGHCIDDCHHYYIPSDKVSVIQSDIPVQWFEQDQLEQFCCDERFFEALSFDAHRPDMLAVAAEADGELIGMAGASADSAAMWQIGIDVIPDARNQGIATYLTYLLKNEVLKRGVLPFYGTGESHIQSQKVAVKAGFMPAWWELYTKSSISSN
ncbi:MAG: GNAT family N-acetyltransferase [Saccharofermentanales bacterium]